MIASNPINQRQMKVMNAGAILSMLGRSGPMSRIGLTRKLGLDGSTVTNLIRELIDENLVEPTGYSSSTIGRPKQLLRVNGDAREAVGLHVEAHRISGCLVNLSGQVKLHEVVALGPADSQESLCRKIRIVGERLISKADKSKLLGVSLAYYGNVDKKSSIVFEASGLHGWIGVNIKEFLEKTFNLPCAIEDSTRSIAIAEHWFGSAKEIDSFVNIELGDGIGCAVVLDGNALGGATNSAGEVGHFVVIPDGDMCRCGKRGCLETVASTRAVEQEFRRQFPEYCDISYAEIAEMVSKGHSGAKKLLERAGKYVGLALSYMVNAINPQYVIIFGELLDDGGVVERAIRAALQEYTLASLYKPLQVIRSRMSHDAAAMGVATLLLSQLFLKPIKSSQ
jgi:predicted NBD/HSP70 family sugar kinase